MRELFVWYRVRDERVGEARAAVREMHDALASRWPGLQARLLTRDEVDGGQTWMETYARAGGATETRGIDAAIEDGIATAARSLAALIESPRHVEAFVIGEPA